MELKITLILLVAAVTNVFAVNSYSQLTKVTLDMSNKSVEQVMDEIEKQTEFYFIFNQKQIDVDRLVTIREENKTIDDILSDLFGGTKVTYAVIDRKILLTKEPIKNSEKIVLESLGALQNIITGTISDALSGEALPGVNVLVKGTTTGVLSDISGHYSIPVTDPNGSLIFSFIGYLTQEVALTGRKSIDVKLEQSVQSLDEVVVLGYGTAKKATVTGSITSIGGEKLQASPSTNMTNSLSGMLPGLVAVSRSGEPGRDDALLRIRGSNTLGDNSPLVVIDGIANRSMVGLNSADIENITVLKDASAAIYGAQAANGVILITTKRGVAGKPEVTISVNQGLSTPTVMPKEADAATWAQVVNEIDSYRNRPLTFSPEEIQHYKSGDDPWLYPNTDWFKAVYKDVSLQNNANFLLTGGTERLKYFFSAGYKFQDGNYKNSATNYSQVDFRSNVDGKITDNIALSIDIMGRQENRNYSPFDAESIFRFCKHSFPTSPAFWPNGKPGPDVEYGWNPVILGTDQGGYDKDKRYIFESNLKLNINIPWVKGLSVTGNASIDKNFQNRKLWEKPWYLYSWDRSTYDANHVPVLLASQKGLEDPRLTMESADGQRTTLNALVNYETKIGTDHNIKLLVGSERIAGNYMSFQAYRRYFVSTEIDQLFAGGDLEKNNTGSATQSSRLNYFGRFNYNYREKYLFEFVGRYDGSYMFDAARRFGFFPGFSLGWRVSEEGFWKNNFKYVDYFKLRGSWGQTGNDRIEEYQYLLSYGFDEPYIFNHNLEIQTMRELQIANKNVTWEVANQTNIGFDANFGGHFTLSADYFHNLRTNILWWRNASVPASTGLSLPRENIGEVANQGFDFDLGYNNTIGDLRFTVSINGSRQKNKIVFWDETPGVPEYQKSTGRPMGSELYYQAIGIFRDEAAVDAYPHWDYARPGDIIFEDVNNDKEINALDMVRNDKTDLPVFTGGININLEYKNFYSIILFQGAAGVAQYYNGNAGAGTRGNFEMEDLNGRWTVDNIDAKKPRAWNASDEYWVSNPNTYWLRNSDYLRLKTFEVGYNMPASINSKLGINGMRIFLSGTNLLTFDKLTDYDPEANNTWGTYPPQKVFNAGLQLRF